MFLGSEGGEETRLWGWGWHLGEDRPSRGYEGHGSAGKKDWKVWTERDRQTYKGKY
jgi:hypothetical protein